MGEASLRSSLIKITHITQLATDASLYAIIRVSCSRPYFAA